MNSNQKDKLKKLYEIKGEKWDKICKNFPKLPNILPKVPRIIVFGDVHGDMKVVIKSLKIAKLIDQNYVYDKINLPKWIGGNTVIVQLGDQIDSCRFDPSTLQPCKFINNPNDKANDTNILELFTYLHNEAQKYGGAVYSILGNHELMNVKGNMDYVSHENINEFSDFENSDIDFALSKRKREFSPGNKWANFLGCTRQVALQIGSNLFTHAGIVSKLAKKYKIEDINVIMSNYLWNNFDELKIKESDFLEIFDDKSNGPSPLWNRIYGREFTYGNQDCSKFLNDKNQLKISEFDGYKGYQNIYPVGRILVGHTPQMNKKMQLKCNDKIGLLDYAPSFAFNKFKNSQNPVNIHVLEILNDNQIQILE